MLSLIDNAVLQGLTHAPAVLGVAIAFRVLRYPDLTAEGSFLLGSTLVAATAHAGGTPAMCLAMAVISGALAGMTTGLLSAVLRVNRLLSGILTSMACYSLGFRVLGRRPNLGLLDQRTFFTAADSIDRSLGGWALHPASLGLCALVVVLLSWTVLHLLRSDMGIVLQAVGANEPLAARLGRSPNRYRIVGLALANALIALSAALVTMRQGFADVNIGTGIVVVLIACLVMGEETLRVMRRDPATALGARVTAPAIGAVLYFALFLLVIRASSRGWLPIQLEPTDLTFISALLIVFVYLSRLRAPGRDELLPL